MGRELSVSIMGISKTDSYFVKITQTTSQGDFFFKSVKLHGGDRICVIKCVIDQNQPKTT